MGSDPLPLPDEADEVGVAVDGWTRYAQVPEWVVTHPSASDRAVRVWCALWLAADWRTGIAEVSRGRLAEQAGKSVDSTDRAIGDLVRMGAVRVEARLRDGRQGWNVYRLQWTNPTGEGPRNRGGGGRVIAEGGAAKARLPIHTLLLKPTDQRAGHVSPNDVDAVIAEWCEVRGIPAARSLRRSWFAETAEWLNLDGPVDAEFMRAAAAAGIERPAGWGPFLARTRAEVRPAVNWGDFLIPDEGGTK